MGITTAEAVRYVMSAAVRFAEGGARRLEEKIAASPDKLALDDLAQLLTDGQEDVAEAEAVVNASVPALLSDDTPVLSRQIVRQRTAMANAKVYLRRPLRIVIEGVNRELAEGRRLTETTAWQAFAEKWTSGLEDVFRAVVESSGADDVLACACDSRAGPTQSCAIAFLAKLATEHYQPLSAEQRRTLGLRLRDGFITIPPSFGPELLAAWVACDPDGAEAELSRRFDASGESDETLIYYLSSVPRTGQAKREWHKCLQRMVGSKLHGGVRIDLNLKEAFRGSSPSGAVRFLSSLPVARLPDQSRLFVVQMLQWATTPEAITALNEIAATPGQAAEHARKVLARGTEADRQASRERDARLWRESGSAESLRRLYLEHIQHLPSGSDLDQWMTLLGAPGVRQPFTFRAVDDGSVSLFIDIDDDGRLCGMRFDE